MIEEVLVAEAAAAVLNDPLGRLEEVGIDDTVEHAVRTDPRLRRIDDALGFQFEGDAIVEVVADVFFIGQDLVDDAARPGSAEVGLDAFSVQRGGDLAFRAPLEDKHSV